MGILTSIAGRHLVIFGCGYIGGAMARAAVARGATVTALTRNPVTASQLRAEGIEVVVGDLAGDDWHSKIPGSPEFLLNCVSGGGAGLESYRHSYVRGMASIVAWARGAGAAGTAVYTSSTSVYPQGDGAIIDEDASTAGGGDRAQLLLEAEATLRGAEGAWRRAFVLRLVGIYGPGRHYLLDQVRAGEVTGVGEHRLNLIHRGDAVAAILAGFTAAPDVGSDVFNVADDDARPKAEVVAWLAERLAVPAPRFTGASNSARRALTPDRVIANGKLKARLGWQPAYPTFREGYDSFLSR